MEFVVPSSIASDDKKWDEFFFNETLWLAQRQQQQHECERHVFRSIVDGNVIETARNFLFFYLH